MLYMKILLWANALVFALYGIAFIFSPEAMSQWSVETVPATASALVDVRATYGGMMVAVGVIFGILAASETTLRVGVWGVFWMMLLMAGSRAYGIIIDGAVNNIIYIYLIAEVLTFLWAVLLLITGRKDIGND